MASTRVEFHTGVIDRVDFACRLLRKAYRAGARLLVTAPAPTLRELDVALWTFEAREFVPHLRLPAASAAAAARTPVWLAERAGAAGAPPLLVNVGAEAPDDLDAIERLIEVVGAEPDEAGRGRERWRAYRAAGLSVIHHSSRGEPRN